MEICISIDYIYAIVHILIYIYICIYRYCHEYMRYIALIYHMEVSFIKYGIYYLDGRSY